MLRNMSTDKAGGTSIYLNHATRDRIARLAERSGKSRSEIIARALGECLPRIEAEQDSLEAYRRGVALAQDTALAAH